MRGKRAAISGRRARMIGASLGFESAVRSRPSRRRWPPPRRSSENLAIRGVTRVDRSHPAPHAAVAHRAGARRHWSRPCRRPWPIARWRDRAAGGAHAASAAAFSSASVMLALVPREPLGRVDLEPPLGIAGEVHQDALAHVPAAHRAAGSAGNQRCARGPTAQRHRATTRSCRVGGNGRRPRGQDPVDAGALGVGGAGAEIGAEDAPNRRGEAASAKLTILGPMSDAPRAQLIHIDVDRRLGHEWDEWDGRPLPNQGNYDSPPSLFFGWSAVALAVGARRRRPRALPPRPRLAQLHPPLPGVLWSALRRDGRGALALVGRRSSSPIAPAGRCCPSGWPSGGRSSGSCA